MVSVFGACDLELHKDSFQTIERMEYLGDGGLRVIATKTILGVVGMIPEIVVSDDEWEKDRKHLHEGRQYIVAEKLGYDVALGSRDVEMCQDN